MDAVVLSHLTRANAEIGQFDHARRCIGEAMTAVETTKETWYQAEVTRIAGEVSLLSPERDVEKAEACFRACACGHPGSSRQSRGNSERR